MKIGFTGTQRGMTEAQIHTLAQELNCNYPIEFHYGDCIGADAEARSVAAAFDAELVMHPPVNSSKRAFTQADQERAPKTYMARNHAIVDETDYLIATPGEFEEQLRSGTWATVRYARKRRKEVRIIYPDGSLVFEDNWRT